MIDAHTHMTYYVGPRIRHRSVAAAAARARGSVASPAIERAAHARDGRDDGAGLGRGQLCRHRDARLDQPRRVGRAAHVRRRLGTPARASALPRRRRYDAHRPRTRVRHLADSRRREAAGRRRRRLHQDVRLYGERRRRHRQRDVFIRRDEGRGRRGEVVWQAHRDSLVRGAGRTRRRLRGRDDGRARDRSRRRDARGNGEARHDLRAHHRSQSLLRRVQKGFQLYRPTGRGAGLVPATRTSRPPSARFRPA